MAKNRICQDCNAESPGDTMFCAECGAHLDRSDRFTIERKIQRANCPRCGHFNPIELDVCESCGRDLSTNHGAAVRDEHGKLRLIRPEPLGTRDRLGHGLALLFLLGTTGKALDHVLRVHRFVPDSIQKDPLALAVCVVALVALMTVLNPKTRLDYKSRAIFAVWLAAIQVLVFAEGLNSTIWPGLSVNEGLLWAHNLAMGYCLFFLVSSQFLGGAFTSLMCLVGLWCSYASLVHLFRGYDFGLFMGTLGDFADVPVFLTPGFLTFNVFLPFVFLQMIGHFFHQIAMTRSYEVTGATDKAVLAEVRRRNLQGVFLNLFVAGMTLAMGLFQMNLLGKPNLVAAVWTLVGRFL